jgi:tetratricopeptide (TPR) repeat protein
MMKFHYPLNLALAGVLVVPTVALQSGAAGSLEESLQRTLVALEHLTGIEGRLESGAPAALEEVLEWTEPALPPGADPAANDALLEQLRAEVGGLQVQVDVARRRVEDPEAQAPPAATAPMAAVDAVASGTTGLDETTRRRLSGQFARRPAQADSVAPVSTGETTEAARAEPGKAVFEEDGYAADALLLGRALYRQARYAEAVEALKPHENEAEGRYWVARCLEKQGQRDEALEAYAAVIEMVDSEGAATGGDAHLAQRAREDIEFINWRIEFEKTAGGKRPQ